ncbi:fatty acid desaturase family protein [Haloferula sp.]|uniref:fatty acid desaturase family protein n=1 Tax=Haloferula sp. TaxID=2497595 RepID=UPI003C78A89B
MRTISGQTLDLKSSQNPRAVRDELSAGIEDQVQALHHLSGWHRSRELLFFIALYGLGALTMVLGNGHWVISAAAVAIMGLAMNSSGLFIHEGLHGLLWNGRRTNRLLSFLVGIPSLMSASAYRVTHTYHHFELGKARDLGTYRQHARSRLLVWLAYFAQLIAGSLIYVLMVPVFAWRFSSKRARLSIIVEYAAILGILAIVGVIVETQVIVKFWLLPLLVMNFLTNLRGLASHALGDVENIYLASRTVMSPRWVSWLLLHENFHLEHHLFPKVPSYHLSELHRLIWPRLPNALKSESYGSFLKQFAKAALRLDLQPLGVVTPASEKKPG